MRVTITIDDDLHAEVKRLARERGQTMGRLIEDALRLILNEQSCAWKAGVELPTISGGHLRPGVNLDNNAALQDLMDDIEDFPWGRESVD